MIGRLNLVVLCLVGVTVAAITGCGKRQPPSQVTPPQVEPPKAPVNAAPAGPMEVPDYPEPADNGFEALATAAEELRDAEGVIGQAYGLAWDRGPPQRDPLLREHAETLDAARAALDKPCLHPKPQSIDELWPYLSDFRALARLLALEGRSYERAGLHADAAQSYAAVLKLPPIAARNGVIVHTLVGIAITNSVAPDLARCIGSRQLSEDALETLRVKLEKALEDRVSWRETLAMEWYFEDMLIGHMEAGKVDPEQVIELLHPSPPKRAVQQSDYDEARAEITEKLGRAIEDAQKPYWQRTYEIPEPTTLLGQVLMPIFGKAGRKVAERDAVLLGLRIQVAVESHHMERGALPKALSDLAPRYLSDVPPDPFTGNPFRYRPTDGSYLLYSVGPDAKDDGGAPLDHTTNEGDIVIWPWDKMRQRKDEPAPGA